MCMSGPAPYPPLRPMSLVELGTLRPKALAISASTGGPEAVRSVLSVLRGRSVRIPILITQHLGSSYTQDFIAQIEKASGTPTYLAEDNLVVLPGTIYVAGGGKHMTLAEKSGRTIIMTNDGPEEHHCKPSANPMLRSMAKIYGRSLLSIMLTGMGDDGIEGVREVIECGGYSVAQDEVTSRVWGMPKAVHEAGLAHATLPLADIAKLVEHTAA